MGAHTRYVGTWGDAALPRIGDRPGTVLRRCSTSVHTRDFCALVAALAAVAGQALQTSPQNDLPNTDRALFREPIGPAYSAGGRWPIDQLRLPAAWDITTGSTPGPLIAVIDTGIHITPDLVGRVELESVVPDAAPGNDVNGHGTKVAGIIAASGTDNVGSAGVCWTCRILSIQASTTGSVARRASRWPSIARSLVAPL